MKTVGIYMGAVSPNRTVLVDDSNIYVPGYFELSELCRTNGIDVVLCRGNRVSESLAFEQNYRFVPEGNGAAEWFDEPIELEALYVKDRRFAAQYRPGDKAFNEPEFSRITGDKWEIYNRFPELCAKTVYLESDPTADQLAEIPTDRVVLKPLSESGGKGIHIVTNDPAAVAALGLDYPYLAQEFLDTSAGIPGICDGPHDLRLVTANGKLATAYFRRPPAGGLLANISLGGSAEDLTNDQVPADALAILEQVDASFRGFPRRMYSVDVLYANGRAYLCELNDKPGFPLVEQTQYYKDRFNQAVLDNFKALLGM